MDLSLEELKKEFICVVSSKNGKRVPASAKRGWGKRYRPGAKGRMCRNAFGNNLILKIDYRVIKDDHIKIFSNYDSNDLFPSLHLPALGDLSPHSIPYFVQLHLKS